MSFDAAGSELCGLAFDAFRPLWPSSCSQTKNTAPPPHRRPRRTCLPSELATAPYPFSCTPLAFVRSSEHPLGFCLDQCFPAAFLRDRKRTPLGLFWPFAFRLTDRKYKLQRWSDNPQRAPQANSNDEETAARVTVGRGTRGRFRGAGRGLPRADSAGPSCRVLKRPPAGMEGPKQPRGPLDASHRAPAFRGFSRDHLEQLRQARSGRCRRALRDAAPGRAGVGRERLPGSRGESSCQWQDRTQLFSPFNAPPPPKLTSQLGGRREEGRSQVARTHTPPGALCSPMETQTQAVSFAFLNVKDRGRM